MANLQLERVGTLWFLTLGVTAVATAILVYILLIESALGAFSIREASPFGIEERQAPRVAVLTSDYTRQAYRAVNPERDVAWLDVTYNSWRDVLLDEELALPFREISDQDLEAGDLDAYNLLILPSSSALSDRQIEQVQAFMNDGGSVLATWTPGVYRPDGSWRGWSFVEETFGTEFISFVERGGGNYQVFSDTFPGFTPPGVYRPERYFEDHPIDPDSSDFDRVRLRHQQRAESLAFAPLSRYVWSDSLGASPPSADYATADTLIAPLRGLDGEVRVQPATIVTFYTYTGGQGLQDLPFPYTGSGIRRFTLRGSTPLTAGIPNGYRAKVQVYNAGVRMRVTEPDRSHAGGFWYDFATEIRPVEEALESSTGLVYGTYGEGRFVYMGFQRDALGVGPDDPEDQEQLALFFGNVLDYLRREPIVWVSDWPFPYEDAALVAAVGHDRPESLGDVQQLLASFGEGTYEMQGTYFVQPDEMAPYADLLRRLHATGDVGVLDYLRRETDGSDVFQARRLAQLRVALERLVDGPVQGYRPEGLGRLSDHTMAALSETGYSYFLPDSIGRRMVPKIMGFPYQDLMRVGLTVRHDAMVLAQQGALSPDTFLEDIMRVDYENGLYRLVLSSDLLGAPQHRDVLRNVLAELADRSFWVPAGDELAHWWRIRRGLAATAEQRGPSRVVATVSNHNGATATAASVYVLLGHPAQQIEITPEVFEIGFGGIETDIPYTTLSEDGLLVQMNVEHLKPQDDRIYSINLLDEEGDPYLTARR